MRARRIATVAAAAILCAACSSSRPASTFKAAVGDRAKLRTSTTTDGAPCAELESNVGDFSSSRIYITCEQGETDNEFIAHAAIVNERLVVFGLAPVGAASVRTEEGATLPLGDDGRRRTFWLVIATPTSKSDVRLLAFDSNNNQIAVNDVSLTP